MSDPVIVRARPWARTHEGYAQCLAIVIGRQDGAVPDTWNEGDTHVWSFSPPTAEARWWAEWFRRLVMELQLRPADGEASVTDALRGGS